MHARWIEFIRNVPTPHFGAYYYPAILFVWGCPFGIMTHHTTRQVCFHPGLGESEVQYILLLLSSIYIYPGSPFHLVICHNQYSKSFSYHSVELKNRCLTSLKMNQSTWTLRRNCHLLQAKFGHLSTLLSTQKVYYLGWYLQVILAFIIQRSDFQLVKRLSFALISAFFLPRDLHRQYNESVLHIVAKMIF